MITEHLSIITFILVGNLYINQFGSIPYIVSVFVGFLFGTYLDRRKP